MAVLAIVVFADYGACWLYSDVLVSVNTPYNDPMPIQEYDSTDDSNSVEVYLNPQNNWELAEVGFTGYVTAKAQSDYGKLGVYTVANAGFPATYDGYNYYFYPDAYARAYFSDNFKILGSASNEDFDVRINMKLDGNQRSTEYGENSLKLKVFSEALTNEEWTPYVYFDNLGPEQNISFVLEGVRQTKTST